MQAQLKKLIAKRKNSQAGFTLLEILVVVAIMGFLVAMVAPRFAGILGGTEDVVCDTNQQRMMAALSSYHSANGKLPSGMVNLVDKFDDGGTITYGVPKQEEDLDNPDAGHVAFFDDFVERNKFQLHVLDADEARELRRLGIGRVFNLNAYWDGAGAAPTNTVAPMEPDNVADGLNVLMVGMGHDGTAWTGPGASADLAALGADNAGWGNPEWIGRIIFGIGPESAMIKEGMITTAGLCPAGVGSEQIKWNNYSVLLPRLEATLARTGYPSNTWTAESNGGIERDFNLAEAQSSFMFTTQCPEGHRYPTPDDMEEWTITAIN